MVGSRVRLRSNGASGDATSLDTETGYRYGWDKRLSRATFVAMMQTADLGEGDNSTCGGWLYGTRLWAILG